MKIIKKQESPKFQPITIEITIENEKELEALSEMAWWNTSISELVASRNSNVTQEQKGFIKGFLSNLRGVIHK